MVPSLLELDSHRRERHESVASGSLWQKMNVGKLLSDGDEDCPRTLSELANASYLVKQNVDFNTTEATLNDTSYSVNILDRNLDVITDDDDAFTDCEDTSSLNLDQLIISNFAKSDSTDSPCMDSAVYKSPPALYRIKNINPDNFYKVIASSNNSKSIVSHNESSNTFSNECQNNRGRLVTICEVTEHTCKTNSLTHSTTFFTKNASKELNLTNLDDECVESLRDYNKNITEKILFTSPSHKTKVRETSKPGCIKKNINSTSNNHDATESFILWEKYLKASEHSDTWRTKSLSDVSLISDDYYGDIECSDKNLDLSFTLNEVSMSETVSQKKSSRRTKSCDSLLEEVRHLPHVFYEKYDQFLESLSKEIDKIRSQNVVCTCEQKCSRNPHKKNYDSHLKVPSIESSLKIPNERQCTKVDISPVIEKSVSLRSTNHDELLIPESDTNYYNSPARIFSSESNPSSDLLRVPSPSNCSNNSRLSPKTPTSPFKKRGLYPWEKEVVSPVGEYIKGKRQSPFQKSPLKKRL
ncbi:hypothetical protein QAD02_012233 [Eretmocerus hayati]|uniref:Uncharacterized protein n=1 Tax=Eretmocerus hayati TaxID=131215 RepID=A0ACC2NZ53_9HYME|nr:hypothetical protein QAD02_012233 [Eretmocerus hayati]